MMLLVSTWDVEIIDPVDMTIHNLRYMHLPFMILDPSKKWYKLFYWLSWNARTRNFFFTLDSHVYEIASSNTDTIFSHVLNAETDQGIPLIFSFDLSCL